MDRCYQEALNKSVDGLTRTIPSILDLVLVKMNTYFLNHQLEMIRSKETSLNKIVEFVNILKTMQNEAFFEFLQVLDELKYRHMANEIRLAANLPVPPPPQITTSLSGGNASMIPAPPTNTDIFTQKPTMKLAAQICDFIAAHWMDIGYCLDFDEDGNEVDMIEEQVGRYPKKCCLLMLKTWIQGKKGKEPKIWQTLLDIIISLDHKTAHDKVKEYLQHIQSEQQRKAQDPESVPLTQPIEETNNVLSYSPSTTRTHSSNTSDTESLSQQTDELRINNHQPIGSSQD